MEKLQAAIAKARRARGEPDPARAPAPGRLTRPAPETLWDALAPLEVEPRRIRRARLAALTGGPAATPYDMLRTKIVQQMAAKGWTRLAITSPGPACGKTTTAANLAGSLSRQEGIRALLIDVDMRRPGLARLLGQRPGASVADVLEGRAAFADAARRLRRSVAVAMSDAVVPESAALLMAERTATTLDRIEADYAADLVIFDLPPLFAGDDTAALLPRVDCALIVAAAEKTTIAEIDACERELAEQTSVLGVALNKVRLEEQGYGRYDY